MKRSDIDNKELKELYRVVLELKNIRECERFFRDLCTMSELTAMAERFQAAKKIDKGEKYRNVSAETGLSTATVTRVAHWLHHGMGGYRLILNRLKK